MDDFLGSFVIIMAIAVRMATPFLFASLGELFSQRSGVFNLGVEGIMMMGAFSAFYMVLRWESVLLGLLVSLIIGACMGLIMALVSVTFRAAQGIAGIGLYMVGWGLSGALFRLLVGGVTTIQSLPIYRIFILGDIPYIGRIFFQHNLIVYASYLLVPVAWFVLYKTEWGLKVRAVGHTPEAADSLGISVAKIRYQCVILGSMMAGLAGAFLSVGHAYIFADAMTAGRGFIAVALVYFARWSPWGVLLGSLLFSIAYSFQLFIQVLGIKFPYEFAVVIPYALVIVVLALSYRRVWSPAALGKPFIRE